MTIVCSNCGFAEKDDSSQFCQACGSNLPADIKREPIQEEIPKNNVAFISSNTNTGMHSRSTYRKKNKKLKPIVIVMVVFFFIFTPITLFNFSGIFANYHYVDSLEYKGADIGSEHKISLRFDYGVGDIDISISDTLGDTAYQITQKIFSKGSDDNYTPIENNSDGETIEVLFIDRKSSWIGSSDYKYEIKVTINNKLELGTDIDLSTGNILAGINYINTSKIDLETSTGDIFAVFKNTGFTSTSNLNIATSTGDIDLSLDNPQFYESTGNSFIKTSTGSIEFSITNVVNYTAMTTQDFNLKTSTGDIYTTMSYDFDVGESVDLSVSTGSINVDTEQYDVDGKDFTGSNEFYLTSSINFKFKMETSTGDITLNYI